MRGDPGQQRLLLSIVGVDRLEKLFTKLFDEREFLSPYGLRAVSAYHHDHPYELDVEGFSSTIDYEPAESTTDMFGGNSNWRGPLWFPLNYLICSSRSSRSARTAGGPASGGSSGCSTTRPGRTTWCSTSTSTATTAPGSAPRTRPGGRG